jgi:hypothetical protein
LILVAPDHAAYSSHGGEDQRGQCYGGLSQAFL